jgi:hypothetical protein
VEAWNTTGQIPQDSQYIRTDTETPHFKNKQDLCHPLDLAMQAVLPKR